MSKRINKIKMLYDLYSENPKITNTEAAELLDTSPQAISVTQKRLIEKGCLSVGSDGAKIIAPFAKTQAATNSIFKNEVVLEMINCYLEDFHGQETFSERIKVGREIRLLLDMIR